MPLRIAISDALNRRVPKFPPGRLYAFQLAVADITKGRATGHKVHTSALTQRDMYVLTREPYTLYYSLDPAEPGSLVFEEFLSEGEENVIMNTFAEGPD